MTNANKAVSNLDTVGVACSIHVAPTKTKARKSNKSYGLSALWLNDNIFPFLKDVS